MNKRKLKKKKKKKKKQEKVCMKGKTLVFTRSRNGMLQHVLW